MTTDEQNLDEVQSRRNLAQDLEGVEGLIYRIATTLEPNGLHAAALSMVCEAIYLARQVMAQDQVGEHDVEDLLSAIEEVQGKGLEWQVTELQRQIQPLLPERLQPDQEATRVALDFALHEWLSQAALEGKSAEQLAEAFTAFCEAAPSPARASKRRAKTKSKEA